MAASFAGDGDSLARAFQGLSDDGAAALGRELLTGLEEGARTTGDRRGWAFAANRIPWPHVRGAAREFQQRIDAWTVQRQPTRSTPRQRIARLALRLLRAGAGGRELLHQLDQANATMEAPIAAEAVGDVARWAAAEVRRLPRVA